MERAERVLRETLSEHAEAAPQVERSLVPTESSVRRRSVSSRMLTPALAAGLAVVAVGVGATLLPDDQGSSSVSGSAQARSRSMPDSPTGAAPSVDAGAQDASAYGSRLTLRLRTPAGVTVLLNAGQPRPGVAATGRVRVVHGCFVAGRRALVFPRSASVLRDRPAAVRLASGRTVQPGSTVQGRVARLPRTALPVACRQDGGALYVTAP